MHLRRASTRPEAADQEMPHARHSMARNRVQFYAGSAALKVGTCQGRSPATWSIWPCKSRLVSPTLIPTEPLATKRATKCLVRARVAARLYGSGERERVYSRTALPKLFQLLREAVATRPDWRSSGALFFSVNRNMELISSTSTSSKIPACQRKLSHASIRS